MGAKILGKDAGVVLFKQKDFLRPRVFNDRLVYDDRVFGPMGTWAPSPGGSYAGMSVGANTSGLICANTNIKSLSRAKPYDLLCEMVLRKASTLDEAVKVVRSALKRDRYGWTNLLVATPREVGALEISDRVVAVRGRNGQIVRTNHFLLNPDYSIDYRQSPGTKTRYKDAEVLIGKAKTLNDIFSICRSHRSMKISNSICCHGPSTTVYSYVFRLRKGNLTAYVCQGKPCRNSYVEMDIALPPSPRQRQRVLSQYPSRCPKC
jgi:hypothetical protein